MTTAKQFLANKDCRMEYVKVFRNPTMATDEEWMAQASHYRCTIIPKLDIDANTYREVTIFYSLGSAHRGREPNLEEVIETLAMDSQTCLYYENVDEFSRDLGYTDPDIAQKVYDTIMQQHKSMIDIFGEKEWTDFVEDFEEE